MYKSSADNRLKSGEIFLKISCQWRKNFMPVRFPFHASGRKNGCRAAFFSRRAKNLPAAPFPNNTANHKQNKKKRRIKEISANIA